MSPRGIFPRYGDEEVLKSLQLRMGKGKLKILLVKSMFAKESQLFVYNVSIDNMIYSQRL